MQNHAILVTMTRYNLGDLQLFKLLSCHKVCKEFRSQPESKEKRGENSDFWFLGRTVRADIFGRIYLGSKKFSQMAAFVGKSKNIESSLNLNNYCQISIQLACLT